MKAPDFELKDLESGERYTLSQFRGKPILLTFWVSWCPDCQRDLPKKVSLFNTMDKDALHVVSINVTGRERAPEAGLHFIKEHPLPFPALADHGRETYDAYKCQSVPSTFLIDKDGEIIESFGDLDPFTSILQALSSVLND